MGTDSVPVRVVVAAGGAAWEAQVVAMVEAHQSLLLARRCVDLADLLASVTAETTDVVLVSPTLPGLDLDVVARVRHAGVRWVPVREDGDRALTIGSRLGLGDPVAVGDLGRHVRRWQQTGLQAPEPPPERARLIAVWGPTGAPGRSSVALTVSSALAARGHDTVLLDADVEGGAQAQAVGLLDDVSGLVAAIRAASQGRADEVVAQLQPVEPRLRLLTGLPRADMAEQIRPAGYAAVLGALLAAAEVVVADCGFGIDTDRGGRGHTTVETLRRADEIVVVGRADPLGLTRLVRSLHDLAAIAPGRAPRVVINHARRSLGWGRHEVDATLARLTGVAPEAHLPWDQAAWDAAVIGGRTPRDAAPSSPFVARVEAFASTLVTHRPQAT